MNSHNLMTKEDFEAIFSNITLPHSNWSLTLRYDGMRPYLQVEAKGDVDNVTGEPMDWRGRKWWLSQHMSVSEVVRTAYKAVVTASMHELDEKFKYRGVAIFDPHLNVDILVDTKYLQKRLDTREERTTVIPEKVSHGR